MVKKKQTKNSKKTKCDATKCSKKDCKKSKRILCEEPLVYIEPMQESWLKRFYRKLFGPKT